MNFHCVKNKFPINVLKMNFHGGKNQFSTVVNINFFSPVTRANFSAGNACRRNALIGLADTRGKTCFGGQQYRENCART